jgi:hypothetical protein
MSEAGKHAGASSRTLSRVLDELGGWADEWIDLDGPA